MDIRAKAALWISSIFAVCQLCFAAGTPFADVQVRALHVLLALTTALVGFSFSKKWGSGAKSFWCELVAIGIIVVANIKFFLEWKNIVVFPGDCTTLELILGGALVLMILEASRRTTGWVIPAIILFMFSYAFILGPWMPGTWCHPNFPLSHIIGYLYYSLSGIYGTITGISATYISIFLIFGAYLFITGAGRTFIDLALGIAGRFRGGPAKVAVMSSALFGSISGSALANVTITGNYTIPLMKRLGYPVNFACGVEAIASDGGMLTPPIMSAAAFVMAELLGIPYLKIIVHAVIPCVLYYTGVFLGVHLETLRLGLPAVPKEEIPRLGSVVTWSKVGPLFIPVVCFLYFLVVGLPLVKAAFWAIITLVILYTLVDFSLSGIKERLLQLGKGLSQAGFSVARLAPLLIAVGMLIGLLNLTGIAPKVCALILSFGEEQRMLGILLSGAIPLLLGMAVPATAAYILAAAIVGPSLIGLGILPLAAHMFLFYCACLAGVTPPVCTVSIAAAGVGGGNWLRVALTAVKLGLVAFFIPFFFVLEPALLGIGTPFSILAYVSSALIGAFFLAFGLFGYTWRKANIFQRALLGGSGLALLYPNHVASLTGATIGGLALFSQWITTRSHRED